MDLNIESLYSDLSSTEGVISVNYIHMRNISIEKTNIALHIIRENQKYFKNCKIKLLKLYNKAIYYIN